MHKKRNIRMALVVVTIIGATSGVYITTTNAAPSTCTASNHLVGSDFEVDPSANLIVNGSGDCIDWLTGGTGTQFRSEVEKEFEAEIGNKDDAFGKGTDEDDETPTVVDGSIPPNKSDLRSFGLMTENGPGGGHLALFWIRVQEPQGTTSFEALFGETCGRFGSAYLKSRSSDSFNAELKDFVAPEPVQISNCLASVSTAQRTERPLRATRPST